MKKHALLPLFLALSLTLAFALPAPAELAAQYPPSFYLGGNAFPSYYAGEYTVGEDFPEGHYYFIVPEDTPGGTLHITLPNGKTRSHGSEGNSLHALFLPEGTSLTISGAGGLITMFARNFLGSSSEPVRFSVFRFILGDQGPGSSWFSSYAVTALDESLDACYKIIDPGYDTGDHDVMTIVPLAYGVDYTIPPTPDGYILEIVNAAIWAFPEEEGNG